jgi:protein phosphatase
MCIEMVYCTDTGRARDHNEDCIAGDKSLGLAILADGMGGYQAGEVASEIAIRTVMEKLRLNTSPKTKRYANHRYNEATVQLEQSVLKANQVIYNLAEQHFHYQGMGTTVVAVLFHNNFISVAHVGDSRLYRLRGKKLIPITTDHSVVEELKKGGYYTEAQARQSKSRNLVTKALGKEKTVDVEIQEYDMLAQDIYLLCSDGLTDMLDDRDIYTILSNAKTLEQAGQSLVDAANAKGGKDNISLILVRPLKAAPPPSWLQRLINFFNRKWIMSYC